MRRLPLPLAAALAAAGAWLWWRNPSPCPYSQRFWIELPRPFITRERLLEALAPRPGERLLEIGPGMGYYTHEVADALLPGGHLDVLDVQPEMLEETMRRARERGLEDVVVPTRADARELPYGDATFDGAFLVTVLGEVPDQDRALTELRRVLEPGGRLVVGELAGDPHMVTPRALRERAERAGFTWERRVGPPFGSFTVLRA